MAGLSAAVKAEMQKRAQEVKDRQAAGTFTKNFSLTGKNAIVEPGGEVIVRFGPRWTIALLVNGKLAMNPEYKSGEEPIFVGAWEHWWDTADGKTTHEWCPKTINREAECPVCIAASILMKSAEESERKYGKRIAAKEVFIFNAVVGVPRKLADGKADLRTISVPGTVYTQVSDIMTGGETESFARGNVGDHAEGYDLKFTRPRKDGNDRWAVTCAPNPSPLYDAKQAQAFAGWPGMLVNLEEMLTKETKTGLELFKAYYGRDPEGDEVTPGLASGAPAPEVEPEAEAQQEAAPEPILDEFMPKPAGIQTPRSTPPVPTPPKATPPARSASRTGGRR